RNFGYDKNHRTYLGAAQSLLVYDAGIAFPADTPFTTLIRKLTVNGTPIFGPGAVDATTDKPVRFKHSENTLRFDYAGLFTDVAFGNQYAVQLEGLNPDFSGWDKAAYKEYTNLEPGQYRFCVKSRNLYGVQSDTAEFHFRILPPWWETWWFYLTEISLLILLVLASFLLNRSGEVSRFTKILTFVTLVVVFESIMFVAEPFAEAFGGGVPVVQLLLNIGLAMMLQPSQELISQLLIERRKKRRYKITFDADGQWQGGVHILTRVRNIEDVVPWCDTFKKEYGDIDRKYRRYVLNDWELDSEEKKDLLAEMEDLLTVLLVFRRQILPGRPDRFSSLGTRVGHRFTVRIHPRHWLGEGVVPDCSPFTLDAFTRWLHTTVTDMTAMLDTYASALEDQVLSEGETNRLLGQTEAMICDMLGAMYDIHMSFDD
ncbi:MAG: hypothetical protein MI802_15615, partial [Desulfobacterales bacterium]|nr:hypothetical protein [Desulfobacterales bacterium]